MGQRWLQKQTEKIIISSGHPFFVVYWSCNCIIALISKTLTTQHEKYSEDDKDVFTYLYGLPDDTWLKPDEKDPLSVVDQVDNIIFAQIFSANVF